MGSWPTFVASQNDGVLGSKWPFTIGGGFFGTRVIHTQVRDPWVKLC